MEGYEFMMKKLELVILTGNIGSGKSLLASKYAKRGHVVVNMDSIVKMIHGGEYGMYDVNKKPVYHKVEQECIRTALSLGFSVVVDRTNMKISDRKRYINIGKDYDIQIHSHDFGPGNKKTLKRRLKNPHGIPVSTWESVHKYMAGSYESSSLNEGLSSKDSGIKDFTFYAFDFDGTIVKNKFPEIGEPITKTCDLMHEIWADIRNIIIIWTNRSGDYENQARDFLVKNGIPFDFINENPLFETGSRKIFAHKYYDDRNSK